MPLLKPFRSYHRVAGFLLTALTLAAPLLAWDFKSAKAQSAWSTYEQRVQNARERMDREVSNATTQLHTRLNMALKDAMQRSDLDEANSIKAAIEQTQTPRAPIKNAAQLGEAVSNTTWILQTHGQAWILYGNLSATLGDKPGSWKPINSQTAVVQTQRGFYALSFDDDLSGAIIHVVDGKTWQLQRDWKVTK